MYLYANISKHWRRQGRERERERERERGERRRE
jgi:hypothetical protein